MASSVINSIIRLASVVPLSTTRGYILYSYSFSYLEKSLTNTFTRLQNSSPSDNSVTRAAVNESGIEFTPNRLINTSLGT